MRKIAIAIVFLAATNLAAQIPVTRVATDAKVIDRVAEASTNDLPKDVLKRIVNEDIDLLRGKRADGTYQYAAYDRMEAGRKSDSFSVDPERKESVLELRDVFPYRLIVNVPSRRMMVAKNHHIYIDRVEIETLPQTSSEKKFQTVKIDAWLEWGREDDRPRRHRQAGHGPRLRARRSGRLRERDADVHRGAHFRRAVEPLRRRGRKREGDREGDRP